MITPISPSLVIVDDHVLFRQGLQALLVPEFDIVGVGANSSEAKKLCADHNPDMLLLDVELGSEPADNTIRTVRRNNLGTVIVVLTMFDDAVLRRQLLRAGASDYVLKTTGHQVLASRMRLALAAGPSAPSLVEALPGALLSPRELEVLRLVAAAHSNREIASHLTISEGTAKRHIANIYGKVGAVSRLDAVTKASRLGLL